MRECGTTKGEAGGVLPGTTPRAAAFFLYYGKNGIGSKTRRSDGNPR